MAQKKALLISTLTVALALFSAAATYQWLKPKASLVIKEVPSPTMGMRSAPIEVVLIEDFQCHNCRAFSQKIIPKLQAEYVKTGTVRFTLVPVSFLKGSQMVANAALEVYHQQPDRFFLFLRDVLDHEGEIKMNDLIRFARRIPGIDLDRFNTCVVKGCHNQELARNLGWAQEVMGAQFRTPALYINGAPGSTFSFEAIQYQIEQILGKKPDEKKL